MTNTISPSGERKSVCRVPDHISLLIALLFTIAFSITTVSHAQDAKTYNPKPASGDILLPMPAGYKMTFRKIPVPGKGYWGGSERIFKFGASGEKSRPFEAQRLVRIGGNFSKGDNWYLVVGKYEVSLGQYVAVMGEGDLDKGFKILGEKTNDRKLKEAISKGLSDAARARLAAMPLSNVDHAAYTQFMARYNAWCLKTPQCTKAMKRQFQDVGYFRLPMEHEWEYFARGGADGARKLSQLPVPLEEIPRFAHFGSRASSGARPIGSLAPHGGLHDVFGNVGELMANPFSMDPGGGTVGGNVARGGSFRTPLEKLRVTFREEVQPFIEKKTGPQGNTSVFLPFRSPSIGIRLMVGAVVSRNPAARSAIEKQFSSYLPISFGVPDLAGQSRTTAKKLGTLVNAKRYVLEDSVGGEEDPSDVFRFNVSGFGKLLVKVDSFQGEITAELNRRPGNKTERLQVPQKRGRTLSLDILAPGEIVLKLFPKNSSQSARYRLLIRFKSDDPAGNIPREAMDLGRLGTTMINMRQFVGPNDQTDFYGFFLEKADTVSVSLVDMTGDADLEILSKDEVKLEQSNNPDRKQEQITLKNAKPGRYFIRVFNKGKGPVTYRLLLARGAIDTAGNSRDSARDIGELANQTETIEESVGKNDTLDFYKFRLIETSYVEIEVGKLEADVDIFLYDQTGRKIQQSRNSGTKNEDIEWALHAGNYFIEVRGYKNARTNYFLSARAVKTEANGHRGVPYALAHGATFKSRLFGITTNQWAAFNQKTSSPVRIDMRYSGRGSKLDVDLYLYKDENGELTKVGVSNASTGTTEQIAEVLEPGRYLVRVVRHAGEEEASFQVTVARSTYVVEPRTRGKITSSHGDWSVGTYTVKDKKTCYAFTAAQNISPSGWRAVKPMIYFSMGVGSTGVYHRFDKGKFYQAMGTGVTAAYVNKNGRRNSIPLRLDEKDGNVLETLERCSKGGGWCISSRGLRGLTKGRQLFLTGRTSKNQSSQVTYSLIGYQAAVRKMIGNCNGNKKLYGLIR